MSRQSQAPSAIITGSAVRIGAAIASSLHAKGYNVLIHYRKSKAAAYSLCRKLNSIRENSAITYPADLCQIDELPGLVQAVIKQWGRLDLLVNSASDIFVTNLASSTPEQWNTLMGSNLMGPYFLAKAALPYLKKSKGNIINIADSEISLNRPFKDYSIYSIAKAGIIMLTKCLATELAPDIRVNALSPGTALWARHDNVEKEYRAQLLKKTLLQRKVRVEDIVQTIWFFIENTSITGQNVNVDCGKFW